MEFKIEDNLPPRSFFATDLPDIGVNGIAVALGNVVHRGVEMINFVIQAIVGALACDVSLEGTRLTPQGAPAAGADRAISLL